jgi:hypothetical protein
VLLAVLPDFDPKGGETEKDLENVEKYIYQVPLIEFAGENAAFNQKEDKER